MASVLISADELKGIWQQPDVAIIDCRFSLADPTAGAAAYTTSHIPGAHYVHLDDDLSGPIVAGQTGRHPLPEREAMLSLVRKLGITNHHTVIAYDANNGAFASRFWWLMRWLGHEQVRVLDGGFDNWMTATNGQISDAIVPTPEPSNFAANSPLARTISASELEASRLHLTDARELARFRGEVEPIDPVAGHIPGAICLPFTDNLAGGLFRTASDLKTRFLQAGLSETEPAVCYCGSGVTACHNILAISHAGLPTPILYAGSWSEWITNPDRPIATGE